MSDLRTKSAPAVVTALVALLALTAVVLSGRDERGSQAPPEGSGAVDEASALSPATLELERIADPGAKALESAFRARQSDVAVEVSGSVRGVLADERDETGAGLQRFMLELSTGRAVLVSHRLGAERVPFKVGDAARVAGRYAWNNRGGVIADTGASSGAAAAEGAPAATPGWIEHMGRRYE